MAVSPFWRGVASVFDLFGRSVHRTPILSDREAMDADRKAVELDIASAFETVQTYTGGPGPAVIFTAKELGLEKETP